MFSLLGLILTSIASSATPRLQNSIASPDTPQDSIVADRPGIADGSFVIPKRSIQFEIGGQFEAHDDSTGRDRLLFLPFLFRVGLCSNFELRVEGNGIAEEWTPGSSAIGYTPVSLGAKYQFQQPTPRNGQVSLGCIGRVFAPIGSGGFQPTHVAGDFRLASDWQINSAWSVTANLGVGYQEDGDRMFTTLLGAMTISRSLDSKTTVFVDSGIQAPEDRTGSAGQIVDFGLAYIPRNNVQYDISIGTGVSGHTTPHPFLGIGYSVRF